MQPISPALLHVRYPVPFHSQYPQQIPYPQPSIASPQSLRSIDTTTIVGPIVPPVKIPPVTKNHQGIEVDLRRLILFNLPLDLIEEYLELYLEYLSGESEIERIDYSNLEDSTVMVTFKTELGSFVWSLAMFLFSHVFSFSFD